uniref:Junctional adhesion molecule B-like n=2 Tax=Scleropages formosus TaxID=113540 RepID=A0A8C9R771_SCLFO
MHQHVSLANADQGVNKEQLGVTGAAEMGAGEILNFWALNLFVLSGVLSGAWDVQYPKNEVCAVRGSTVVIPCTYVYPGKNHVQKMWCHHHKNCIDTKYVCHSRDINVSPEYKGRAECLGNEHQNCSLKVKNITDTDAGKYRFRFITNSNQWTGQDGVTLTITELRVSMKSLNKNGKIREGDSFNLTCATKGCSLSQSEFIWVKDKERLLETHSTLQFINVSCRHKGNYSCALKGGGDRSEEFQLDIQVPSCPETSNSSLISIIVGTLLTVLAVVLVLLIYFKRKKNPEEDRERKTQVSNDSTTPVTTGHKQEGISEEDEVSYASVQFLKKKPPERSERSERQSHNDGVIYSSVSHKGQ